MRPHPLLSRRSLENKVIGTFDRLFTGAALSFSCPAAQRVCSVRVSPYSRFSFATKPAWPPSDP